MIGNATIAISGIMLPTIDMWSLSANRQPCWHV